ncbi:Calcium-transporting ATPase 3 [Leucoagaricus sp. SymC.cos]|nr:Calcium-transporting ATPase 3 [Leucoagaricus sp. SymC.cos]
MGVFNKRTGLKFNSQTNTTISVTVLPNNPDFKSVIPITHTLTQIIEDLGAFANDSLSKNEVLRRLESCDEILLQGEGGVSALRVLIGQLANALTLVLIAALDLSFGIQDFVEEAVVTVVIVLNTTVGFLQEYRAEKTMDSLRQLSSPSAFVIHNGEGIAVPAKDVVSRDIIPADLHLITASNLEVPEQLLTGESAPVAKMIESSKNKGVETPIGGPLNLCYVSTVVTKGRATGIVIATGMDTQIGRIATAISGKNRLTDSPEEDRHPFWRRTIERLAIWLGLRSGTPLQIKLNKLAYILFSCAVILAIIVFSVARWHISDEVVLYSIATAIAIILEPFIAVLTLTMAVGTRKMTKEHMIVRKLDALENLGGVTDICSDKTGTLTLGQMSVRKFYLATAPEVRADFTAETNSDALKPVGENRRDNDASILDPASLSEGLAQAVRAVALCNIATIRKNLKGERKSTGDPTEVPLQVFATKLKLGRPSPSKDAAEPEDNRLGPALGKIIEGRREKIKFADDEKNDDLR